MTTFNIGFYSVGHNDEFIKVAFITAAETLGYKLDKDRSVGKDVHLRKPFDSEPADKTLTVDSCKIMKELEKCGIYMVIEGVKE